jgi:pseudaminic acid cytidylyltransferase
VSTDDPAIAEVARAGGAETPFLRPAALADDHTPTVPVIRHALDALAAEGYYPQAACCLYATAPLVRAEDLRAGREVLREGVDYAVSVTSFAYPVQRALRMTTGGCLDMVDPAMRLVRSQDLEERYHDAAQFYWGWTRAWREERPIFAGAVLPVLLPRARVQDIDTPEDLELAKVLHAAAMVQRQ